MLTRLALAALTATLCALPAQAHAANETVQVWRTATSGASLVEPMSQQPSRRLGPPSTTSNVIGVDSARTYQTIDGFGGAMTDSAAWLIYNSPKRTAIMKDLFGPGGAAYSMIRLPLGASDIALSNFFYDYTCCDLGDFSVGHDAGYIIPILGQARQLNPSVRIVGTPWSAPGWMKYGGSFAGSCGSGLNYLQSFYYTTYAAYLAKFVTAYRATYGIPIHALSIQNEPRNCNSTFATMNMEPADQAKFALDLRTALDSAGFGGVKIIAWDHNWYEGGAPTTYPQSVLSYNGGQARQAIDGVAYHCYESPAGGYSVQTTFHNAYPSEEVHFTECTGGSWSTDAAANLVWAMQNNLIGPLRNWARTSMYWSIALDPYNGPYVGGCTTCRGMLTVDNATGTYRKNGEYYVWKHFSKVVQPGAVRIDSSDLGSGSIQTVAFRNPDRSIALIALNSNGSASITFRVGWAGQSFDYTLPARSAASFRWTPAT
jgi:glucosylceramidase